MTKRFRENLNDELGTMKRMLASNSEDYTAVAARITRLEDEQLKNKMVFAKLARFSRVMKKRFLRLEQKFQKAEEQIKTWGLKLLSDTAGSCEVTLQADGPEPEWTKCDFLSEEEVSEMERETAKIQRDTPQL